METGSMPKKDQGVSRGRYQVIPRTLIFITRGDEVLLLKGAPHKRLWAGLYNGIGGHLERGEDVYHSARRELKEETGLDVPELHLVANVIVDVEEQTGIGIFIFKGEYAGGQICASEEGSLEWVAASRVSQLPLVEDLYAMLPRVLGHPAEKGPFFALYQYDSEDHLKIHWT